MDFELDDTQRVIASSAADVLTAVSRVAEPVPPEPGSTDFDRAAWQALARAGLLALNLPSWLDGDGLGALEAAVLLTEVGRQAATVPALATIMLGVLPVVRWGSQDLQARLLAGVGAGETILTAAVREATTPMAAEPATAVTLSGGAIGSAGWGTVSGTKIGVPYADEAAWLLVPARLPAGGSAVVIVDRTAAGITLRQTPVSGEAPEYTIELADTPVTGVLGIGERGVAQAGAAVDDLYRLAAAGAAATGDGAVAGALALTTSYLATREQFGRPLATFQAVAQQIADVYITGRTLHLAAISACWRLATGRDAGDDADVAAYWLAQEAPAALRTCHHLHGGIGMDISYPLHRYSSMVSDLARFVGGADYRLELLAERAGLTAARTGERLKGGEGVFIELTESQQALASELRAYFAKLITPAQREAMRTDRQGRAYREIVRQLGSDGWLGVGWPVEYGGRGFGAVEQQIFVSEASRADVPLPAVTLQTVGPTLQAYGTAEQKDLFLHAILAGEVHFAIGYTEPAAGTDLAALTTRAVRDGDSYVVNGQKTFTTGAHDADYIWLAVRTDPDAPKHRGISILIVDTADPGFSWTPIITIDGAHHVNATYYSDVRVPVGMRVGEENAGWRLVTTQLNHERVMLGPAGRLGALHDRVLSWAAGRTGQDGRPVLHLPDVRRVLGLVEATMRVNELLNWQVAVADQVDIADASATKVFSSERLQRLGDQLAELVGRHGDAADPATAELMSWLDVQRKRNLVLTFGGGVNEIQRELIATAGLGLPRVPR